MNFHMENIDDNSVYIVKDNDSLISNLKINGFYLEKLKSYIIAYK